MNQQSPYESRFWYRHGLAAFVLAFGLYLFITQGMAAVLNSLNINGALLLANTIGQIIGLGIPLVYIATRIPPSHRLTLSWHFPRNWTLWGFTFLGLFGLLLLSLALPSLLFWSLPPTAQQWMQNQYEHSFRRYQLLFTNTSPVFTLIAAAVVPALCEELAFRGILLNSLCLRFSTTFSLLLSAGLFALVHLNPAYFLELFLLGNYLGYLALRTQSLFPAIIVHFVNNFLVLTLFLTGNSAIFTTILPVVPAAGLMGLALLLIASVLLGLQRQGVKS